MTEDEKLKRVLSNNLTLAFLTATSELLHDMEFYARFREKQVLKSINKKLNVVLKHFDRITEGNELHQRRVDSLMEFFTAYTNREFEVLKEIESGKEV